MTIDSDLTYDQLARIAGFDPATLDALDNALAAGGGLEDALFAPDATGVGATDRVALQAIINSAIVAGQKQVSFPPGTYVLDRALEINNADGLTIRANAKTTITYPSDVTSTTVPVDYAAFGNAPMAARSAIVVRGTSTNVTIDGLNFQGGTHQQIYDTNVGCAIYATALVTNLKVVNCNFRDGYSALQHEQDGFAYGNVIVDNCTLFRVRGPMTPCNGFKIRGCTFAHNATYDLTGRVTRFVKNSGTSVTVHCPRANVTSNDVGKYVYITGSTTNDFAAGVITAVTAKTGTAPATFTFTRTAGANATEAAPSAARYFIPRGDKTGLSTTLTKSGSTMTLVVAGTPFTSADIGKSIRVIDKTNAANCSAFPILTVPASNTVTFGNTGGVNVGAFTGVWTSDAYDNVRTAGINYGSTHAIYMYAGRGNGSIEGCHFYNIRGSAVKMSGSTSPIENVSVIGCHMVECASAFLFGADDSQEHNGLKFSDNVIINCANGRPGWTEQNAFYGFGCRGLTIKDNTIFATHDDIASVDGHAGSAAYAIYVGRYRAGLSQPVELVDISGNTIFADALNCTPSLVAAGAIHVDGIGLTARYNTGGVLTFAASGLTFDPTDALQLGSNVMRLVDGNAYFCQEMGEGWVISIVNDGTPGNNVTDVPILRVVGTGTIYFTNATGATSAGPFTYRIRPPEGKRGSSGQIRQNTIAHFGAIGVQTLSNTHVDVTDNTFHNVGQPLGNTGSVRFARNRLIGQTTLSAGIRLDSGTVWPIVHDNPVTTHGNLTGFSKASFGEIGIGVDSPTRVDHPLLGVRGKVKPTDGKAESMFAYGPASDFVDGDFIVVSGTTFTYKASGPTGNQFNTMAGLMARIDASAGGSLLRAADYGAQFAAPVVTGHVRVRFFAASTSNAAMSIDSVNTCNPTVLVALRNSPGSEAFFQGVGEQTAGPLETRTVIHSPCVDYSCQVNLTANEATAAALLAAGGFWPEKAANNAGACEVLRHNDTAGTEEFRWSIC